MKWLTNMHNNSYNAESNAYKRAWLADKIIGEPKGTDMYTSEKLKELGFVGVYSDEDEPIIVTKGTSNEIC